MRAFFAGTVLVLCHVVGAFVSLTTSSQTSTKLSLASTRDPHTESTACTSRRKLWEQTTGLIAGSVFLAATPAPAFAKDSLEADKEKLLAGYKRLNYLLDNWEKETTNCKTKTQYSSASNPCERTPLNVQYYLGYKSTEDPLFRADKTMRRLESLVPPEDTVDYLDAMEKFREKAEEGKYNTILVLAWIALVYYYSSCASTVSCLAMETLTATIFLYWINKSTGSGMA